MILNVTVYVYKTKIRNNVKNVTMHKTLKIIYIIT